MNYFNYFSEIEELFIRRRGRNLLLSPLDWALIETWQERGVPLRIILRGIETVFDAADKQPVRKKTIKSLLYCKDEIESQYTAWLEMQIGKKVRSLKSEVQNPKSESNLFSGEAIEAHLEKVFAELNAAKNSAVGDLRKTLETISKQLAELARKSHAAEQLEESLEKLDARIDESLLKNLETESLKDEIKKQIASYKTKMEREVYQRTFDLMLLKKLRERAEIPRLSLFYL
ncbi:MAG: hypothetical protein ACR2HG_11970 [Pyrinomonadaceae bacterium]